MLLVMQQEQFRYTCSACSFVTDQCLMCAFSYQTQIGVLWKVEIRIRGAQIIASRTNQIYLVVLYDDSCKQVGPLLCRQIDDLQFCHFHSDLLDSCLRRSHCSFASILICFKIFTCCFFMLYFLCKTVGIMNLYRLFRRLTLFIFLINRSLTVFFKTLN